MSCTSPNINYRNYGDKHGFVFKDYGGILNIQKIEIEYPDGSIREVYVILNMSLYNGNRFYNIIQDSIIYIPYGAIQEGQ